MDFNSNETVEFKKTIEDIVSAQFYREGVTKYVAAKITAVNSDGTFNAIIPPDDEVEVVGLLNKSNDALQVGDSVELVTKNGKLSNAWISAKHKKNHFGFTYSPDGQNRGLFDYDVNDWIYYKSQDNNLNIPYLADTKKRRSFFLQNHSRDDAPSYYLIAKLPVSNTSNRASVVISGLFGGYSSNTQAYMDLLIGNRDRFTVSLMYTGDSSAFNYTTVEVYEQTNGEYWIYVKRIQRYTTDTIFDIVASQAELICSTTPTTPSGNLIKTVGAGDASGGGGSTDVSRAYPVGSIYLTTSSTNPATLFGFGTWQQVSQGRVLIGVGTGNDGNTSRTYASGDTGGEYTHKLTLSECASHQHNPDTSSWGFLAYVPGDVERVRVGTNTSGRYAFLSVAASSADASGLKYAGKTDSRGGNGYHNNIQPYYAVYIWRRTA